MKTGTCVRSSQSLQSVVCHHLGWSNSVRIDSDNNRGVWHTKPGAKGQARLSASQKLSLGAHDKKEPQAGRQGVAGRGQGTGKERLPTTQGSEPSQHPDTNPLPRTDEHVPVNGYNARAVEAAMKASTEPRSSLHKPAVILSSGGRSASAPWASKRMSCKPRDAYMY